MSIDPYEAPAETGGVTEFEPWDTDNPTAGFGIRALARVLDIVYVWSITIVAGITVGVGSLLLGFELNLDSHPAVDWIAGFVATLTFHAICEGGFGATPGKLVCGLRVVDEKGHRTDIPAGFIRSMAYFVDALFFGLVAYSQMNSSPMNQRFGDQWAGTVVVFAKDLPDGHSPGPLMGVIAITVGSVLLMMCNVSPMLLG